MLRWKRTLATALVVTGIGAHPASAAWLEPADLAPANPPAKGVGEPSLAVARDGTAFAAFTRFDGANLRVAVAMRVPGGGFGAPVDLSLAGQDAFNPAIAVDRQGNATLAWMQGPASVVRARFRPAGGDWGEPTPPLSAAPSSRGPSIAVSDNGAAVLTWGRNTGGQVAQVEATIRRSAGQPFGAALPVSPAAGTGLCGTPRVAIDAAGNVAAIWTRRTSATGDFHVESAVKPAGSVVFAPAEPRSTTAGNSDCHTEIAMTPEGRATAMWDFTEPGKASFVAVADRGPVGPWSPAAKISTLANRSITPVFALDAAGDAAAAWLSAGQVVSAVRQDLSPFSLPKPLSGATELSGLAVGAAAGEAIAAFVGDSNGSDAIFAARRQARGEFGAVEPVALTPPPGGAVLLSAPDIGLDDEGNAFAVWQRRVVGTDRSSVQVAPFDPVAPALTAADVPAAATAGQPVAMSAAASDRMSSPALRFDFGDGSAADGAAVQHIYGAAGTYTVTVTATDAAGNRSSTTRAIQIAAAPDPRPDPGGATDGDTEPKRVIAVASAAWDRLRNGRTRMRELFVDELAGPESVRLTCDNRKRGCRKSATKTVSKHRRKVDFTKTVKGMILRPKAKLTITVTRPGYVARVITYTMVKFDDPKKLVRCLPPGAKRLRTC